MLLRMHFWWVLLFCSRICIFASFDMLIVERERDFSHTGGNLDEDDAELDQEFLDLFKPPPNPPPPPKYVPTAEINRTIARIVGNCPKTTFFVNFNPDHRSAVSDIQKILTEQPTKSDFLNLAIYLRDYGHVNKKAWFLGVQTAMKARPDTQTVSRMSFVELMPGWYLNRETLKQAKKQSALDPKKRQVINNDWTIGMDNGVENKLWYFREDIVLNTHHLHWHLTYPRRGVKSGNGTLIRGSRRGELFYYMHHEVLARYNAERLSNYMEMVKPFSIKDKIIPTGFKTHLTDLFSSRNWTDRAPNTPLQDIYETANPDFGDNLTVSSAILIHDNLVQAIEKGYLIAENGSKIRIWPFDGTDILGDVIESSIFNVNTDLYGWYGYHNDGHLLISFSSDPFYIKKLPPGPLASIAISMRDPIFYSWHAHVDTIFQQLKQTLAPYDLNEGPYPLIWKRVEVSTMTLIPTNNEINTIYTYWSHRLIDLANGMDLIRNPNGSIWTRVTHLDHTDFYYNITINSGLSANETATVRIFMAPRYNLYGKRFPLSEQRTLFFVMDMFKTTLKPGKNVVIRNATDSQYTTPWERSYKELTEDHERTKPLCGCGWPHHLLFPRGTPDGMTFDMFVLVTHGKDDEVKVDPNDSLYSGDSSCFPSYVICGIMNRKYPDARPMGYPFDRKPYRVTIAGARREPESIEEYAAPISNAAVTQIVVISDLTLVT